MGSRWALEQAKYNLINEYFLVGVTEELEDFIMLLEATLPRFFRGATELYRTGIWIAVFISSSPLFHLCFHMTSSDLDEQSWVSARVASQLTDVTMQEAESFQKSSSISFTM